MNETPVIPEKHGNEHTRAIIIATTIVLLTCILSCATVMIVLILRKP